MALRFNVRGGFVFAFVLFAAPAAAFDWSFDTSGSNGKITLAVIFTLAVIASALYSVCVFYCTRVDDMTPTTSRIEEVQTSREILGDRRESMAARGQLYNARPPAELQPPPQRGVALQRGPNVKATSAKPRPAPVPLPAADPGLHMRGQGHAAGPDPATQLRWGVGTPQQQQPPGAPGGGGAYQPYVAPYSQPGAAARAPVAQPYPQHPQQQPHNVGVAYGYPHGGAPPSEDPTAVTGRVYPAYAPPSHAYPQAHGLPPAYAHQAQAQELYSQAPPASAGRQPYQRPAAAAPQYQSSSNRGLAMV